MNIFLRSLFISASLNFWKMQNLGLCFSLLPLVPGGQKEKSSFLLRHLQYFYSHPYLSPAIVGALAKEEETFVPEKEGEIKKLKDTLMGPYASLGDQFFWDRCLPFVSVTACMVSFLYWALAPVIFIILFFPLQFWVRWKGYKEGYRLGKGGYIFFQGLELPRRGHTIRRATVLFIALSVFLWAFTVVGTAYKTALSGFFSYGLGILGVLLGFFLVRIRLSPVVIFYLMSVAFCMLFI